ncbi:pyridoxal phosphate-dependent aminotransferase [Enterococcus timonensis]|uniref:pyridoxal phosphate-dependent aminotransferase n=1 Tax=Enterococcus timonensis TaxID=1852364 RepID=UPI0008DA1F5E|nr:pyridoxal phosphate-dependent aminotransferase [Enterococcus timonensis]
MKLSTRAQQISPSATLQAAAMARKLKASGRDVISLTVGEPDFFTPKNIQEKAIESIRDGSASFYTPTDGLPALKKAVQEYFHTSYHLNYELKEIMINPGAKFGLYAAFMALLNTGDEVLIPTPYWVSYSEQVKLADGVPIFVEPFDQKSCKVTPADLEKYRTDKTKVLLMNSPANPTGMIYTKEELTALADYCLAHDLFVVTDDIYSQLVYHGAEFASMVNMRPAMKENTLVITGVSKTYAMTGWRIGFAAGPVKLIHAMSEIQSHSTSNPAAVSQYAAIEALNGSQKEAEKMQETFSKRLDAAYDLVVVLPGFSLVKPQGAFYLFPDVTEAMEKLGYTDVEKFVADILEETGVALVAGTGFGSNRHLRLSYAVSQEAFAKAIGLILEFLTLKK